jgi:Cys-tRNA(Pro)/Cys-tRNA(Cys) deacylase
MKTNAARMLEEQGVRFELREYQFDPDDLSATKVADAIGMPAEQVFKTLLVRGERSGPCFAVIPANCELDLKALARLAGDRKIEMVPLKDVQPMTGYIRGGVTVLGAKKAFPVYMDETAILFDAIALSAGIRGTQIVLNPEDYIRVTDAVIGEIGIPS